MRAAALEELGGARAVDILIETLRDSDAKRRTAAAEALDWTSRSLARHPLESSDPKAREAAANALTKIRSANEEAIRERMKERQLLRLNVLLRKPPED